MNILIVHNTYQQPGGEDIVVAQETKLLERNGHKVHVYKRSNLEIDDLSFGQRLGMFARIVSAGDTKLTVQRILRELRPDIVHVHNTFAMVSPSVYEVCQEEDIPVVQTLHNYRLLCPAASLYRDGRACDECITRSLLRSVRYGCYRDSRIMSGMIAAMLATHRARQTWSRDIDAYIAISSFVRNKYVEAGFPADKVFVKPNFIEEDPGWQPHSGNFALFLGRLSPEKGLSTLLEAWERLPSPVPLVIAGDGPMRERLETEVRGKQLRHIQFTGRLTRNDAYNALKKAALLVVPSIWYEPFGLVIAEAFACGTPVLGSNSGAIQEMLDDQITGISFAPGDAADLANRVAWAWDHLPELAAMGKTARHVYEERYTAKGNYSLLMKIYGYAIDNHTHGKGSWAVSNAA